MAGISWHETLSGAREAAAQSEKLILTYLHAPG